jgi:hypothetical protein
MNSGLLVKEISDIRSTLNTKEIDVTHIDRSGRLQLRIILLANGELIGRWAVKPMTCSELDSVSFPVTVMKASSVL